MRSSVSMTSNYRARCAKPMIVTPFCKCLTASASADLPTPQTTTLSPQVTGNTLTASRPNLTPAEPPNTPNTLPKASPTTHTGKADGFVESLLPHNHLFTPFSQLLNPPNPHSGHPPNPHSRATTVVPPKPKTHHPYANTQPQPTPTSTTHPILKILKSRKS